ncbi:hypothetical protein A7A78_07200 [Aequorivita soesokkakensis]|uniref:YdhG-like domain-containing protein n=1 Tax=Aequorivita soesokkakensis TaxID=1385699 RepID=A0A1A9LD65_9FLAO|nr:DUF1801 domain-containing protein [Aequorivita soesokkakensis]OAD90325.1 hypothetical protein A7A78_07200 [Aequorivita soesokkakensis]
MEAKNYKNTEEYILQFPKDVQIILKKIREIVLKNTPNAIESISYGMPAFKLLGKPLVYFAGYKNHIGFYALPSGNEAFKKQLSNYKTGKGSIQFPISEEIPWKLINDIVKFRTKEIEAKLKKK